jgi:hydroxypyruvate isomerase
MSISEITNFDSKFYDWFGELDNETLRCEKLYHDLSLYRTNEQQAAKVVQWLKAAYDQGVRDAAQDSVDTLRQYATALAGIRVEESDFSEIYDHCAVNLASYWHETLNKQD